MPAFEFQGLNRAGKQIKGVRDADSERALRAVLKREGILITRIGTGPQKGQSLLSTEVDIGQYFEKIKPLDVAIFTRQLATLVRAGIPLVEALAATAEQTEKPKLRKVLAQLRQDVSEGMSLAQAVKKHPEAFTAVFPNMIRAGEASGTLDAVLMRLAEFTEASVKLRQKITSAMMYPIIMVGLGGLILIGLFVYVIPQITQIFEDTGAELPILTRLLIGFSGILRSYWWLMLIGGVGGMYAFRRWKKTPKGSATLDRFLLKVPILGSLILMIGTSRFTRTLSTLLRSGVPLLTALDITKNVLGNKSLIDVVSEAQIIVKEGGNLGDPLKRSGYFPPMVTHMIAVGERSGALEEMLTVVSDAYETQVENRVAGLTSLLEPVMIVGMGITIAIIVFAVLMPILQLNEFVQ